MRVGVVLKDPPTGSVSSVTAEVTSSMFTRFMNISRSFFRLSCGLFQSNRISITALRRENNFLRAAFKASYHSSFFFSHSPSSMDLKTVLEALEQLAPLSLAESWDNVGLLVEPSKQRPIKTILLTNDLTADVMDEAEATTCDLIVSYHPPLFSSFKRLVQKDWKQQLAIRAIESGIAVFSPHTSWDSVRGGLNDWLIEGVGSGQVSVLRQAHCSDNQKHRLEFTSRNEEELNTIMKHIKKTENSETFQYDILRTEEEAQHVILNCSSSELTTAVQAILGNASAGQSLNITQVQQLPLPGCGQGRHAVLDEPISTAVALQRVKKHLGLPYLRLALGNHKSLDSVVKSVAVCAGSGASVLQGVKADLYITGEMSHHEVLDAVSKGTSVILSEHSNSERGFLPVFKERLTARLSDSVRVIISQKDKDPLQVV
ncbi:NIF3-like protein 1 [Tachysurus fulvidraco]|uniref:NIF3-like protein 1 n=1 Tax=Tachysurus fulvidraco TaxID=1234273 RepID=UPI001FED3916|nr:NIF3-like protein 1 [Tachysurus fulvidraco]XP_027019092.2 NIF3-like protein 1 [Tachysurus fulvidraco]